MTAFLSNPEICRLTTRNQSSTSLGLKIRLISLKHISPKVFEIIHSGNKINRCNQCAMYELDFLFLINLKQSFNNELIRYEELYFAMIRFNIRKFNSLLQINIIDFTSNQLKRRLFICNI